MVMSHNQSLETRAWEAAATVFDPEIPDLSVIDLGVIRGIFVTDSGILVTITPTYSGCPAMETIAWEIELALARVGIGPAEVRTVRAPAWSSDWITERGRAVLLANGIAPPPPGAGRRALFGEEHPACPRCNSQETECLSEFGATACRALWRCRACAEPFDAFKCH